MYLLGQAIWYAGAILLHVGAEAKLEDALPYRAFVWMESIALGAWQGIAAAAGVWLVARGMKLAGKTRRDAFSAGLAGGGLELFLIGIGTVLGLFITFGMGAKSDKALFNLAYSMAVTPGLALVDPAIQVCGVVCRVAATMLIVGGMRFRRYGQIALGVFVFGAVLTAASAARTIELLGPESRWLLLGVSAGVSAFAILVLRRSAVQWPEAGNGEESPMEVFLRQHGETGEDA